MSRSFSVRSALAGKHVLAVGVTGFLGKVFLAFLLHEVPEIGKITLLGRKKRGKDAGARLREAFERSPAFRPLRDRHGDGLGAFLASKIDVVSGDAREPLLGIAENELAVLSRRLDVVVNVAGLTDFAPDPADAVAVNVRGALAAADVAARTKGRRLLHMSTAFVAGAVSGAVPETTTAGRSPNGTDFDAAGELRAIESVCESIGRRHSDPSDARRARIEAGTARAHALGWPNLYTYSKGLAEHLLFARRDVTVTMVRPSIVECARTFPFAGWNEGLNTAGPLVWLTGTLHRRMPFAPDHVFDVVPVDTVARSTTLVLALLLEGQAERIYQVASGTENPFTLGRALDLTSLARRRQYARSDDPLERLVLQHLDSVISGTAPQEDPVLPTARTAARMARDVLIAFDPEIHLPEVIRSRFGARLATFAQKAGKSLGTTARTLGQVAEMLRLYQPFIFDHDPHFRTDNVQRGMEMLSSEERTSFGHDVASIDWRSYWLEVQIPGLDRWSLPLLRGERPENDPPFDLGRALAAVGAEPTEQALELTSGLYGDGGPGEAE